LGEEDQRGRHDGDVREQRIDGAEGLFALRLHDVANAANKALIIAKVPESTCGAPDASSRNIMEGNHGRALASSTIASIQASILRIASPGPSAMARARAPTVVNTSSKTAT
jgi:hypothetical protein